MAEETTEGDVKHGTSENFICGVVEGFYGRPWTTEQRKDLFKKLKKWGMNSYIYAPKDDYKHRAYWRQLYTVEEADHLTGLITAAHEQGINFYYALSPGLDITYSSTKEISALKRKLDQVLQFGCKAFALLFDDIEPEMSKPDKEVFQSFAYAQVSVTNEIYNHLNCPRFLFCPTQYCSTRAMPTVKESEYLNTLGSKLIQTIDVMWTGSKVISKILSIEGIDEITQVLQRKPVIWDNLHANDYDQKRVFLGPYSGRSPELIPLLGGVVTNPNCEFHANTIAIQTLAYWSQCSSDTKIHSSISSDIKLETENEEGICQEDAPAFMNESVYHPRLALIKAIEIWLPEFYQKKEAWGPICKPQPAVTMVMPILPIIPSINTCMSLTTTSTTTTTTANMPEVNTTQLQLFADVCSTVTSVTENISQQPVMNSLVSETKVITNDTLPNPLAVNLTHLPIPHKIPVSSIQVPIMSIRADDGTVHALKTENIMNEEESKLEKVDDDDKFMVDEKKIEDDDVKFTEDHPPVQELDNKERELLSVAEPMECGSNMTSPKHTMKSHFEDIIMCSDNASTCSGSMQVESSSDTSLISNAEMSDERNDEKGINTNDIMLLCDMFYLPFEHGGKALQLLTEFHWLKTNASVLVTSKKDGIVDAEKTEVQEWFRRSDGFEKLCQNVTELAKKLSRCANKELCYDLFTYVWDITGVLSLLSAYIKWLALGNFPANLNMYTLGSYTWFSKGWKEAFMSGDQEPWVFRGGLIADLQRLIPLDAGNDLFTYKFPETPTSNFYRIRPYSDRDEADVYRICHNTCRDGSDCTELFPENLQGIPSDRLVGPFITITPELCMVCENSDNVIIGYVCAALDAKMFYRKQEMCWLPEMCLKYPLTLLDSPDLTQPARDSINHFHNFKYDCPQSVLATHPSILSCCILKEEIAHDESVSKRLITVLLAALRSYGKSFGVHVCINRTDSFLYQFYSKLGFVEIYQDDLDSRFYLGRNF